MNQTNSIFSDLKNACQLALDYIALTAPPDEDLDQNQTYQIILQALEKADGEATHEPSK